MLTRRPPPPQCRECGSYNTSTLDRFQAKEGSPEWDVPQLTTLEEALRGVDEETRLSIMSAVGADAGGGGEGGGVGGDVLDELMELEAEVQGEADDSDDSEGADEEEEGEEEEGAEGEART